MATRFQPCCGVHPIKSFHRRDGEWCVTVECIHCLTAIIHRIDEQADMTAQLKIIARLWSVHQLAIQKFNEQSNPIPVA